MPEGLARDGVNERDHVGDDLVFLEADLADAGVDVAALVGAVLDLAGLEVLDRLPPTSPVMTVPALGVGIKPRGPSILPRRLTLPIKSCVARATSKSSQPSFVIFLDEVVAAGEIGAGLLGLGDVIPLAKDDDADGLTHAERQRHGAAHELIALGGIDAEPHVDFHGLVELGPFESA